MDNFDVSERALRRNVGMKCFCNREVEVVTQDKWPTPTGRSPLENAFKEALRVRFKYIIRCANYDKCVWCYYV